MDKFLLLLFLCLVLLVHSWRTIQSYSLFIVRCVPGDGASKSIILITTTKKKNNDFFGFNDVAPMISILFRDISEENNIYLFIIYKSKHLIKSQIKLFMKLLWNKLFLSFSCDVFLWLSVLFLKGDLDCLFLFESFWCAKIPADFTFHSFLLVENKEVHWFNSFQWWDSTEESKQLIIIN